MPSPEEIAQFNADVVAYMESHPGMWNLRTRPLPLGISPALLLPRGLPYIVIPSIENPGTLLVKYVQDARRDKVT